MGGDPAGGFVREHLGLVLSLVTGTVVFARLLLVSGFNYETAVTLLTLQGTATTIVGSLLAVANLVPFAALLIVGYAAASDLTSTGSMSDSYRNAYVALSLITVLTAPLVLGVVVAIALVASAFVGWRMGRADQPGDAEASPGAPLTLDKSADPRWMAIRGARRWTILWAVIVGGQALAYAPPWMPAEQITTTDDHKTTSVVGYVLKTDDHELVVLLDSPREVKRLTSASGFDRAFCEIPINLVAGGRPLIVHLLPHKPSYSRCPPASR